MATPMEVDEDLGPLVRLEALEVASPEKAIQGYLALGGWSAVVFLLVLPGHKGGRGGGFSRLQCSSWSAMVCHLALVSQPVEEASLKLKEEAILKLGSLYVKQGKSEGRQHRVLV